MRVIMFGVGVLLYFAVLLDGYQRSLAEVAGLALAGHAMQSCPNWYLGLGTGAFGVGLVWWFKSAGRP